MRLPASVVEERDAQIYQAKNRGLSYREIAAKLNISQSTAHAGYLRQQSRLAKLAQEDAVNGIWSHLDKMDALERALWPLAKERKVKIVDPVTGAEAEETLPPDYSAIRELRGILGDRAKIMGWNNETITMQGVGQGSGPDMATPEAKGEKTTEDVAKELASELIKHEIATGPLRDIIEQALALETADDNIVDAEVVDEGLEYALSPVDESEDSFIPPAWIDDDDDEYVPGGWVPDNMQDGNSQYNT